MLRRGVGRFDFTEEDYDDTHVMAPAAVRRLTRNLRAFSIDKLDEKELIAPPMGFPFQGLLCCTCCSIVTYNCQYVTTYIH